MFSLASIATMVACIFLFGAFFSVIYNVRSLVTSIEEEVGITVLFEEGTSEERIQEIGEEINAIEEVSEVTYTSPEEAWEKFQKEYFKDNPEYAEGFADDNPLAQSASYTVKVRSIEEQNRVADTIRGIMADLNLKEKQFLGIGISVPGPVRRKEGVSEHAYRIWNDAVEIGAFFRARFGVPVIVENNVKAFAEAELIFGAGKEQDNILLVKWGPGVGSAIVINKRIYDNQKGRTSELGHIHVNGADKLCRCGRRGCLETEVSTHAIAEKVREQCTEDFMPIVWNFCHGAVERLQARNIRTWADIPDSGLKKVFDSVIMRMAGVAASAATLLAPDRVVYFGDLFRLAYFKEKFPEYYRKADITYEDGFLEFSRLSDRTDYIGPLALVFNEILLQDR